MRVEWNAGVLRLLWEDPADTGALFNLYAGDLTALHGGFDYSPVTFCGIAGAPGTGGDAGWLYAEIPPPAGQTYFLVTASSQGGEGTAGPGADITSGSRCGALP